MPSNTWISWIRWLRIKTKLLVPLLTVINMFLIYGIIKYNTTGTDLFMGVDENAAMEADNEILRSVLKPSRAEQKSMVEEVVFYIILCEGKSDRGPNEKIATDINRQLRQASVMLKSAVALTSSFLKFIVIADSEELYQRLLSTTDAWPHSYKSKLEFEYHSVWYPPNRDDMKQMFRVCATERLFLPTMFPKEDAGIYIDTDLIFLRPPEDLWNEFKYFDDVQEAAMAPCLYHYGTKKNQVPFYGTSGLNAGIMHMNFTRMNSFSEKGWVQAVMKVFDKFKRKIKLADQDILNIFYSQNPKLLYELNCSWNYRVWQCSQGENMCPETAEDGAFIIHGNALSFVNGREMKFQTLFEMWENYELGTPLKDSFIKLKARLLEVTTSHLPSKCAKISNIDTILTRQLEKQMYQEN